VATGGSPPSLSSSKLMKRTSLSRLLDAGLVWQQFVDDDAPTSHADATVNLFLLCSRSSSSLISVSAFDKKIFKPRATTQRSAVLILPYFV